ncbi:centromere protein N-like [Actinia tenebrosa]|uniref:Centromere protein N-like n=1 Tax=Actinia tenebrosa TaxID=6105 RepID=A0A6P8J1K1_ACTTE|nr:centromere protein N-like [Actinia tenebrosa]
MHRDALKKLFNKFKKDELIDVLLDRGFLDEGFQRTTATKSASVSRILKLLCEKLSDKQVAVLDLIYHQLHPKTKEWDVFLLSGFDPERARGSGLTDPKNFETQICSKLQLYFNVDVCVQLYNNALWIHLAFLENKTSQSTFKDKVYLVYYPLSPYIMVTKMKAAYKQYILQAVTDVLGCTELKQQKLSGKDVQSLADLLLNKKSQGYFSEFRLKKMDSNPLCQENSARRKRRHSGEKVIVESEITEENKEEIGEKDKWMKNAFGSCDQPVLEKVKFTMETRFKGSKEQDITKNPFKCTVKFEGPSVIEGIKNLGKTGAADVPLPSHLSTIHSQQRNHFILKDRKRPREMDSLKVSQL